MIEVERCIGDEAQRWTAERTGTRITLDKKLRENAAEVGEAENIGARLSAPCESSIGARRAGMLRKVRDEGSDVVLVERLCVEGEEKASGSGDGLFFGRGGAVLIVLLRHDRQDVDHPLELVAAAPTALGGASCAAGGGGAFLALHVLYQRKYLCQYSALHQITPSNLHGAKTHLPVLTFSASETSSISDSWAVAVASAGSMANSPLATASAHRSSTRM